MPEQREIYQKHAQGYERLISREDYQQNILCSLTAILPVEGLDIVDMGAGTGRFTLMLAPYARRIFAFDISRHVLQITHMKLKQSEYLNWFVSVADNRNIPLPSTSVDLAIAGWSFGHSTVWYASKWRDDIALALMEMKRIIRPGGTAVIFETLGTGSEEPHPPTETLAAYYRYLESEQGFSSTQIRTDYQFKSLDEAEELVQFFFGDELARKVVEKAWVTLPEWTGIWWLRL